MAVIALFEDRREAGRRLGELLRERGDPDPVVLGLPRGGVPVAFEVARAVGAPLDVFMVRKLGVPGREELAMGAIATGGVCVRNEEVIAALEIDAETVAAAAQRERGDLERREALYRAGRAPATIAGRTAIVVDDGLATGATMRAAVQALRELEPRRIVAAVPVASPQVCAKLRRHADVVVCMESPEGFVAVGNWYRDFAATSDDEVCDLLRRAALHTGIT